MPDEAVVKLVFCTCETGRRTKALRTHRVNLANEFITQTHRRNEEMRKRRLERTFQNAGIPPAYLGWTFKDFKQGLDKGKLDAYNTALDFVSNKGFVTTDDGRKKFGFTLQSVEPGMGKTTLASIAFRILAESGMNALWIDFPKFCRLVSGGYKDGSAYTIIETMGKIELLLLDDIGKTDRETPTPAAFDAFTDILSTRHDWQRPTIFTTMYRSSVLTDMLRVDNYDRIEVLTKVVPMTGQKLRKY